MKNLVLAVGVSVLALAGCDNNANAQAQQVSADVGSPQGNNRCRVTREWMLPRCRKEISLPHCRMREMPF